MTRGGPVLLDLFCGGGGAAMGYHRAGFRVVGVDLQRHRAGRLASVVGVYGSPHGSGDSLALRRRAMGIDWLDNSRLTQAIPPAYTEHIGRQLISHIRGIGRPEAWPGAT